MKIILDVLKKELFDNENILWNGKPIIWKMFNAIDYFLIPLGILWTFGGIFYEREFIRIMLLSRGHTGSVTFLYFIPIIIVIPIIAMGIYLLITRFIVKAYIKFKTFYAITDHRIFIIQRGMLKKIKSVNIEKITDIEISKNKNEIGTIYFNKSYHMIKILNTISLEIPWVYYHSNQFTFFDIADIEKVKGIIDNLK